MLEAGNTVGLGGWGLVKKQTLIVTPALLREDSTRVHESSLPGEAPTNRLGAAEYLIIKTIQQLLPLISVLTK